MMIRQIMEGRYSFSSAEWSDISHSPKDLISKMLIVDHKERLTVNLCLQHDFISEVTDEAEVFGEGKNISCSACPTNHQSCLSCHLPLEGSSVLVVPS